MELLLKGEFNDESFTSKGIKLLAKNEEYIVGKIIDEEKEPEDLDPMKRALILYKNKKPLCFLYECNEEEHDIETEGMEMYPFIFKSKDRKWKAEVEMITLIGMGNISLYGYKN